MTMSCSPKEVEYLANEIFQNEKPVTYHKFSRQLNIPIDQAKIWLFEYYEKNRSKLAATFLITGATTTGNRSIRLSKDESNLDEDVKKFTSISTIHVYSVAQRKLNFTNNDLALEESRFPSHISNLEQYQKNGIIIGPKIVVSDVPAVAKAAAVQPPRSSTKESSEPPQAKPRSNVRSSTISSSYVSRKAQPKVESKPSSISSHYTSRKIEKEQVIPQKRALTEPTGYQYKSRKLEPKTPKDRVVIADHNVEDDDVVEDIEPAVRSKLSTVELEKLFEDEFSDSDDAKDDIAEKDEPIVIAEEKEAQKPQPVSPVQQQEEETSNKETPMEVDQEIERSPTPDTQEIEETPEEANQLETKIDDDGYITTRKARPITKPAKLTSRPTRKSPAPTKSTGKKAGDGKKVQASLMSFFQKK
ncbi:hypothetical protein JA1_000414 [Spathaspora sp. JA1]|nr:hypothetical protein JA1_000414 [Spathaspora sp. JA1]